MTDAETIGRDQSAISPEDRGSGGSRAWAHEQSRGDAWGTEIRFHVRCVVGRPVDVSPLGRLGSREVNIEHVSVEVTA